MISFLFYILGVALGTTVFHRSLYQTGDIDEFGEIFHNGNNEVTKKSNYFYYIKNILKGSINYENEIDISTACTNFLDYILSLSDKEYVLIDVKYNSWHHFNHVWQDTFKKTILFTALENKNAIFIHMVRMNIFAQFISIKVANKTGKWHYKNNDDTKIEDFKIDLSPQEAFIFMENSSSNSYLFRKFLKNNKNSIELIYEHTYDQNGISDYAINKLEQYIHKNILDKIYVPMKKTPMNLKEIVNNKTELIEFFSNKKFENLVGITLL